MAPASFASGWPHGDDLVEGRARKRSFCPLSRRSSAASNRLRPLTKAMESRQETPRNLQDSRSHNRHFRQTPRLPNRLKRPQTRASQRSSPETAYRGKKYSGRDPSGGGPHVEFHACVRTMRDAGQGSSAVGGDRWSFGRRPLRRSCRDQSLHAESSGDRSSRIYLAAAGESQDASRHGRPQ